jgi:hypothetical protein
MATIPRELNMYHLNLHVVLESGKKMEKDSNKRIRRSQEEMKKVLWYFMYIKEKTLGENYKEEYELWRERDPMTRINIGAKLLLNQ